MANELKSNSNSASEDDIGLMHKLTTKLLTAKLRNWEKLIDLGGDADIIIDMKQFAGIIKFIANNGIVCADPAASGETALGNSLAAIKEKQNLRLVANGSMTFTDDEEY